MKHATLWMVFILCLGFFTTCWADTPTTPANSMGSPLDNLQQVKMRLENQWMLVQLGERSGKFTSDQAALLRTDLMAVRDQIADFQKQNGTAELTADQQMQLNADLNENSQTLGLLPVTPTPSRYSSSSTPGFPGPGLQAALNPEPTPTPEAPKVFRLKPLQKLYFFAYNNCELLKEDMTADDLREEILGPQDDESSPREIDIPIKVAQDEIRPLVKSTLYVFSNSKYIGSGKVRKVSLFDNGLSGWELDYERDFKGVSGIVPDDHTLHEAVDVYCDDPIDVDKLKALNAKNKSFIKSNVLTSHEVKQLENEISEAIPSGDTAMSQPPKPMKSRKAFKAFDERIGEGLWKPDDLGPDWVENTILRFSIKFPSRKIKIAFFEYNTKTSFPSNTIIKHFLACKTAKGLFFYPIDRGDVGTRFDQVVNWFGDYYICFYCEGSGGYSKWIYEITDKGLKLVGNGEVDTD